MLVIRGRWSFRKTLNCLKSRGAVSNRGRRSKQTIITVLLLFFSVSIVLAVPQEFISEMNTKLNVDGKATMVEKGTRANGVDVTVEWEKIYGGSEGEYYPCVRQTTDGGYIIAGHTQSFSDSFDFYLIKVKVSVAGILLAPVADAGPDQSVNVGDLVTFDGSGSYDLDGVIFSYDWNFDDGFAGTGIYPTHTYNSIGTYTVTLTVTDNDELTDTDTMTVTVNHTTTPELLKNTTTMVMLLIISTSLLLPLLLRIKNIRGL